LIQQAGTHKMPVSNGTSNYSKLFKASKLIIMTYLNAIQKKPDFFLHFITMTGKEALA